MQLPGELRRRLSDAFVDAFNEATLARSRSRRSTDGPTAIVLEYRRARLPQHLIPWPLTSPSPGRV